MDRSRRDFAEDVEHHRPVRDRVEIERNRPVIQTAQRQRLAPLGTVLELLDKPEIQRNEPAIVVRIRVTARSSRALETRRGPVPQSSQSFSPTR
jgi:hypothetical protein